MESEKRIESISDDPVFDPKYRCVRCDLPLVRQDDYHWKCVKCGLKVKITIIG